MNASGIRHMVLLLLTSLAAAGCEPSATITLQHSYPPAVPIPTDARIVDLADFEVRSSASGAAVQPAGASDLELQSLANHVRQRLSDAIASSEYYQLGIASHAPATLTPATDMGAATASSPASGAASQADGPPRVRISARLHTQVRDASGKRMILVKPRGSRRTEPQEVRTLVRNVQVRAVWTVTAGDGGASFMVETDKSYDSSQSPPAAGLMVMDRIDDPAVVPPAQEIIREMINQSVDELAAMMMPGRQTVKVALRPTKNPPGRKAIEAAAGGNMDQAIAQAAVSVGTRNRDHDLIFNLAVLQEAAGLSRAALNNYRLVLDLTGNRDAQAASGRARMERMLQVSPQVRPAR